MNINCPYCGDQTSVTETRGDTKVVLRRRKCLGCNKSIYTEEYILNDSKEAASRLYKMKGEIYYDGKRFNKGVIKS